MKKFVGWIMLLTFFAGSIAGQTVSSNKISLKTTEKSSKIKLVVDTVPPDVSFISPRLSRAFKPVVNSQEILISGIITDRSGLEYFKIAGQSVKVEPDGSFKHKTFLSEGSQTLLVQAKDNAGYLFEHSYTIEYEPLQAAVISEASEEAPSVAGKYYALIIGVSEYQDIEINDLDKPVRDAKEFMNALIEHYTFDKENVTFLENPSRVEMEEELDRYSRLIKPNDNFLIFYAGHGHWDSIAQLGYWLPADAKKSSKAQWFRNSTLRDYLKEINSQHTLLIADACFGGGIFKTRAAFNDATNAINKLYELPSRKAMTSGTLTQVPDESPFLHYLVRRLKNNEQKYISTEQLFTSFRSAVINNSEVVPQYGEISNVGDEGGDFIFIRR